MRLAIGTRSVKVGRKTSRRSRESSLALNASENVVNAPKRGLGFCSKRWVTAQEIPPKRTWRFFFRGDGQPKSKHLRDSYWYLDIAANRLDLASVRAFCSYLERHNPIVASRPRCHRLERRCELIPFVARYTRKSFLTRHVLKNKAGAPTLWRDKYSRTHPDLAAIGSNVGASLYHL